jgi:hypothetical protein
MVSKELIVRNAGRILCLKRAERKPVLMPMAAVDYWHGHVNL